MYPPAVQSGVILGVETRFPSKGVAGCKVSYGKGSELMASLAKANHKARDVKMDSTPGLKPHSLQESSTDK